MNQVSDQGPGSSSARTWNGNSSSAVSSLEPRIRRLAGWYLRGEGPHLRREGEERICAASSGRDFPGSHGPTDYESPFKNLPEKTVITMGETITAEKMSECQWVKPKLVCQVALVE
jgi:hypothetical protein